MDSAMLIAGSRQDCLSPNHIISEICFHLKVEWVREPDTSMKFFLTTMAIENSAVHPYFSCV
jgi:hypothetical protein